MAKDRLYQIPQSPRWYADLRDLGGGRVSTRETDRDAAVQWLARKLAELGADGEVAEHREGLRLRDYAVHHLRAKLSNRRPATVQRDRHSLNLVLADLGQDVRLTEITTARLNEYSRTRQGEGAAPQTVLHELHALSNLYKRAVSEGLATRNPVRDMVDKPRIERDEPVWLEPVEAARFLEACRRDAPLRGLVALALLTGGRKREVTGLEREDLDFKREIVRFRPNRWRKLKAGDARTVPLWDQLGFILAQLSIPASGLLFPNSRGKPYGDMRKKIGRAVERAGIKKHVSWNTFRHTYASVRLQTLKDGAPISPFDVARELGHQSLGMLFKHYGHVLASPQRLEVMEYRIPAEDEFEAVPLAEGPAAPKVDESEAWRGKYLPGE